VFAVATRSGDCRASCVGALRDVAEPTPVRRRAPPPGSDVAPTARAAIDRGWDTARVGSRWPWTLSSSALLLASAYNLLAPKQASALGVPVNCSDALAYLGGADKHADPITMALCAGPLHHAVFEVVLFLLAGTVVYIVGARRSRAPDPGWYRSPNGDRMWWDGTTWRTAEPGPGATAEPRPPEDEST